MPVIPVESDRHAHEAREPAGRGHDVAGVAALARPRPELVAPFLVRQERPRRRPHRQHAVPHGGVGASVLGPPACLGARPGFVQHGGVEPVAAEELPDGGAVEREAVPRPARIGRRRVEGRVDGAGGRLALPRNALRPAPRVVPREVEPGAAGPVSGGELHAARAPRIVAAVVERLAPGVAHHLPRSARDDDDCAIPEVCEPELRKGHALDAPVAALIPDSEAPAERARARVAGRGHDDRDAAEIVRGVPAQHEAIAGRLLADAHPTAVRRE